MPIDTSSYYPEVPKPDGDDSFSLNKRGGSLFGPSEDKPGPAPGNQPEPSAMPPVQKGNKDDPDSPLEKAATAISHLLSWVLVPLLMPVYGLILAFGLSVLDVAPMGMRVNFTLIVAGITVIVPMILVLLLKRIGVINDIGLNNRKERFVPYAITIVAYALTAWFMAAKHAPLWLSMFFAGGALAALINTAINFKWKISAHAAGIAGVVALLIRIAKDGYAEPEIYPWIIVSIALTGLMGSARVWLGRHTVWQVLAGYIVGFCSVFFLTML
ncbi:MAG: phosphatase PAP2 family protein [Bacteroides sp.]|nr:phosphatase PAP2 family protein [Bacteroides sp.]